MLSGYSAANNNNLGRAELIVVRGGEGGVAAAMAVSDVIQQFSAWAVSLAGATGGYWLQYMLIGAEHISFSSDSLPHPAHPYPPASAAER